jgi:hypothetical protein
MSGDIFNIGVANQANPNNGAQQNRDQPVSGLHFSARHFSACQGSVFLQRVMRSKLGIITTSIADGRQLPGARKVNFVQEGLTWAGVYPHD